MLVSWLYGKMRVILQVIKLFFFIIIQLAASLKMHYYVVWAVSFTEAKKRTFA